MQEGTAAQIVARHIAHNLIDPSPLNDRKRYTPEALSELAAGIAEIGILEPVLLRPAKGERFELIAGHRRWRAVDINIREGRAPANYAMPAIVRAATDREVIEMMLVENLQREDLTPHEEADAFKRLVDMGVKTRDIADRTGISQRTIQQRLDLVERLHPDALLALDAGLINVEQARVLVTAPVAAQEAALGEIREGRVAGAEQLRDTLFGSLPPVDAAFFRKDEYTGEIVEDPDSKGRKLFADKPLFIKLQRAAIKAKLAELRKKHAWAEGVKNHSTDLPYTYETAKKGDREAGAVIVESGFYVKIHAGVIRRAGTQSAGLARAEASKPKAPEFEQAFLAEIACIKTASVQVAITRAPEVAARIAMMHLAQLDDSPVINAPYSQHFDAAAVPAVRKAVKEHIAPIGTGLKAWQRLLAMKSGGREKAVAATMAAYVAHRRIAVDRPDDHPMFVAIARAAKADIGEVFEFYGDCGNEFVGKCGLLQLERIVADLELQDTPAYRDAVQLRKADKNLDWAAELRTLINGAMAAHRKYMPPWLVFGSAKEIAAHVARTAPKTPKVPSEAELLKAHEKRTAGIFGSADKTDRKAAKPAARKSARTAAKKPAPPKAKKKGRR